MKLTAFLLLTACLQVSARSEGQAVTLKVKNATLKTVLREVQKQTGLSILMDEDLIEGKSKVTFNVTNMPVPEMLAICFHNDLLSFSVIDGRVVVRRKTKDISPTAKAFTESSPPVNLKGRVVNEKGEPMAGVTVQVKSSQKATVTDALGSYEITVPDNGVLVFSYVGHGTQELAVNNRQVIDVTMKMAASDLYEVVVTSLGISRQSRSLVYAAQTVKPAELTEVRDPNNVINSLQGKVANAVISQGSGGAGSGASLILRGNRSLQGSSEALIVVDGVPFQNSTYGTINDDGDSFGNHGTDGASAINPDDIESVTVLKGASAAALYGSQAGNGVIIITTKKGRKGNASVLLNSGIVTESAFSLPRVQNTYGQGNGGVLNPLTGDSWGAKMTGQAYTNYLGAAGTYSPQPDNIKDFFRRGISVNNSVGITSGSDKMQTYFSYTNNNIQGIVPRNDLGRHTVNLRLTNQIGKRISLDAKITYVNQDIKNMPRASASGSPTMMAYNLGRSMATASLKQYEVINNIGIPEPTLYPSTQNSAYQNPYWWVNRTSISEKRDRAVGFINGKIKITDWLTISGRANLDKSFDRGDEKRWNGSLATPLKGYYSEYNRISTEKWFDAMVEGKNSITKDMTIDYRVGGVYQDSRYESLTTDAGGLTQTNYFGLAFAVSPQVDPSLLTIQTQAIFGQANISYKDAIFLDASLRNDWDSRLPKPYTFSYPSIGSSIIVSDIVNLPKAISFLKGSINYAEVGNGGKFALLKSVYFPDQGAVQYLYRSDIFPLPNLKPEIVKNIEFGMEARFINNRVGFTATYYKSNSINQLLLIGLPVASGYSTKYINAGNIQNNGFEFVFTGTLVKSKSFNWDATVNFALNRNKVVKLDEDVKIVSLAGGGFVSSATPVAEEGKSFGNLLAFKWATDAKGNHIVDATTGKPVLTADPEYIGNYNPKGTAGFTNSFRYKNFSLRVLMDGRIGGTVVSGTEMNLAFSGISKGTEKYREGGLNLGGVDTTGKSVSKMITSQDFWQTASGKRYGAGEFFAYDATSFRVREISFGYLIPLTSTQIIKSAKLSFVARNLFWLYRGNSKLDIPGIGKRKMTFDPDMSLGTGSFQGVEYGNIPSTRSIGFNLQLNF